MAEHPNLDAGSSAVQAHLSIMQGVIQRMAENSRSCKVWCITIVSATLILVARTGDAEHVLIAFVPTVLFLMLDTYYLALERGFRHSYDRLVDDLHEGNLRLDHLYRVASLGSLFSHFRSSLASLSILPFYGALVGMTIFARWILGS